ncbi:MAG TPA: hypothetical protein VNZ06_06815, partial [Steroidobacteraceae bacterium]|nr:hypothetical protein [Steroidobacteraceae bacterium]
MTKKSEKAKHIESVLNEKRSFEPSAEFTDSANIKASALARMHQRAHQDYLGFWGDLARHSLHW